MKKIISVLLCLVMVFSLSACEKEKEKSGAKNCTNCGEVVSRKDTFCSNCGEALIKDTSTTDSEDKNETSQSETTSSETQTSQNNTSSNSTSSQNNASSNPSSQSGSSQSNTSSSTSSHTHKYSAATCTAPSRCSCGATLGTVLDHSFSSGKCTRCGAKNPNFVNNKTWQQVLAEMPQNLKGTKVVIYNWTPLAEYYNAPSVMEDFTSQTGITVEWKRVNYTEYFTRLAALVATQESPDIVRVKLPVPDSFRYLQPLSTANYDFGDSAWDNQVMKDYTANGKVYATSLKNTPIGTVGMMLYNKSVINRYGLEDPYSLWKNGKWTTNKFIEMCKDYVKMSGNKSACTGMDIDKWLQMHGIESNVAFRNGKFISLMNDAKLLTLTQQYCDYYNINKILNKGQAEIMDAGQSLFYAGASWCIRSKNSYFGTLKSNGTLYAVPMPIVPGEKYYNIRDEYEAYGIAKGAKNPQAVPYVLRYFLDGNNYNLNKFFCNSQNVEVYNWCMAQTNNIWSSGWYEPDSTNGISKKTANQVKSYLDAIAPSVENHVKSLNDAMSKIGK